MKLVRCLALTVMCSVLVGRGLAATPKDCANPLILNWSEGTSDCNGYGSPSCVQYCEYDLANCLDLPCHYAWDQCDDGGGNGPSTWTCQCDCEEG